MAGRDIRPRPRAAHVEAAIRGAAQKKPVAPATRQPAAHVQAAIGAAAQPRVAPALRVSRAVQQALRPSVPGRARVLQRAEDKPPLSPGTSNLYDFALEINQARTGKPESRNTQAVVEYGGGTHTLYTQRWYSQMEDTMHSRTDIPVDTGAIVGDCKDDEGVHAEMLAISMWLQGETGKPVRMGVSKKVCGRCSEVLTHYGISHQSDGSLTQNWCHPHRHAGMTPPKKLKHLPQKVTKGKEYPWD